MFKTNIVLINREWKEIDSFKSRFKPTFDELVYSKNKDSYFKVINVIHSLKNGYDLILVVEKTKAIKF